MNTETIHLVFVIVIMNALYLVVKGINGLRDGSRQ